MRISSLFMRLYKWLRRPVGVAALAVLGLWVFFALVWYRADAPSLFYVDSAHVVGWGAWLRATCAVILISWFGLGAWFMPVLLLHAAYTSMVRRWDIEWDRALAFVAALSSWCLLCALSAGMAWRGSLVAGGSWGRWLRLHAPVDDRLLLYMVGSSLLFASFLIITRVSFVTLMHAGAQLALACFARRAVVVSVARAIGRGVVVISSAIGRSVHWVWGVITGSLFDRNPDLVLSSEQYEQLQSLESIVNDAVWQKHAEPEPAPAAISEPPIVAVEPAAPTYVPPTLSAAVSESFGSGIDQKTVQAQAHALEHKLVSFGIHGAVSAIKTGPALICFEYTPAVDTKLSRITALEDDLALALQATSLRVLAPIPGTSVVGFEVGHMHRQTVPLAHIFQAPAYRAGLQTLPVVLGVDIVGNPVVVDLARMPHLLMAGSTGSGKSVALNTLLVSLLCRLSPDELKLILIDPKRIELTAYRDIAHLMFPVVCEPRDAVQVLSWVVQTMEQRYAWLAHKQVRTISDYHARFGAQARVDMPYLVVVIDELADLMMTAGDRVERSLVRIAQMARAAGIHVVVATQRPSVDVITGLIKVNFPSRISFRVTSKVDSRIILDAVGAEKLLGRGDLLFMSAEALAPVRVHGAYVSDAEIASVTQAIRVQRAASYLELSVVSSVAAHDSGDDEDDALMQDVLAFLNEIDEVSISLLQRRFKIGFNRSARIIELLEQQGRVTPPAGGKTRKVVRLQ